MGEFQRLFGREPGVRVAQNAADHLVHDHDHGAVAFRSPNHVSPSQSPKRLGDAVLDGRSGSARSESLEDDVGGGDRPPEQAVSP